MTRRRNDSHSTEFGLWLREQKDISSSKGFIATNIDYLWENYKTGQWMIIEEKRYMSDLTFPQREQFKKLHNKIEKIGDNSYKGIHLLQFENTTPEDGKIYFDRKEITKDQLIDILMFKEYDI